MMEQAKTVIWEHQRKDEKRPQQRTTKEIVAA